MADYAMCCDECFDRISKRSTNAASLWLDLCCLFTRVGGIIRFESSANSYIRMLELLGFVVSTDAGNYVAVKLAGQKKLADGQDYFCCDIHDDEDDDED